MAEFDEDIAARWSVQLALIREITPDVAAVTCGVKDKMIRLIAYFDHPVTEKEKELVGVWGSEMIAHFPSEYDIHEEAKEAVGALIMLDFWAFARADANLLAY